MTSRYVSEVLEWYGVNREKMNNQYDFGELRSYLRYVDLINRYGSILHDDRMQWTVQKNIKGKEFPLVKGWDKSPYIRVMGKEPRRINGKKVLVRVYGFRHSMTMKFPELQGVRLTSSCNYFRIELHNILNLLQKTSRLKIFIDVLHRLYCMEILLYGSRSYLYRLSQRFSVEHEFRWDCRFSLFTDRLMKKLRDCSLDEEKGKDGSFTLYFNPVHTAGAIIRLYPYHRCFMRFEIVTPEKEKSEGRKGSPKRLFDQKRVDDILRQKNYRDLRFYISPIISRAEFLQDIGISGRDLFHLSQPRNRYSLKML